MMRSFNSRPTGIFSGSLDATLFKVSMPSLMDQRVVTRTLALSGCSRKRTNSLPVPSELYVTVLTAGLLSAGSVIHVPTRRRASSASSAGGVAEYAATVVTSNRMAKSFICLSVLLAQTDFVISPLLPGKDKLEVRESATGAVAL
jgi:hypothetical protein